MFTSFLQQAFYEYLYEWGSFFPFPNFLCYQVVFSCVFIYSKSCQQLSKAERFKFCLLVWLKLILSAYLVFCVWELRRLPARKGVRKAIVLWMLLQASKLSVLLYSDGLYFGRIISELLIGLIFNRASWSSHFFFLVFILLLQQIYVWPWEAHV